MDEPKIPIDGTVNHTKPVHRVSVRGGFSDRNGIKPENTTMQVKSFDTRTRTQMINLLHGLFTIFYLKDNDFDLWNTFIHAIRSQVYSLEVTPGQRCGMEQTLNMLYDTIRADDYDSVLTVIEFVSHQIKKDTMRDVAYEMFNELFEQEYVGYRFIDRLITPITTKEEAEAIKEAIDNSDESIKIHLQKALKYISDREQPDYENSIKESISAVEAECCRIVGKRTSLGDALNKLEGSDVVIHPCLKDAFRKLYNYTSDAKAVRHAGDLGGADATFAEAQFMLVSCSAFINYLKTCGTN